MRGEKKRRWLMGSGIPQDQEAFGAIPLALKSLLFDGQFSIFLFFFLGTMRGHASPALA